jgi:hypothetical protein
LNQSNHAPAWALYDLSLPGREALLASDLPELRRRGARVTALGRPSPQADDFLDGLEIEREWMAHPRTRSAVCDLRRELSAAVDGEVFLRAARRAAALAVRAQPRPEFLFGAGTEESVTAWLAGRLLGVPFVASVEGGDSGWSGKWLERVRNDARSVRSAPLAGCLAAAGPGSTPPAA